MSLRRTPQSHRFRRAHSCVSASASFTRRRSKAAKMSALLLPLTAMTKGMPKCAPIGVVGGFRRTCAIPRGRQLVEPGARLLTRELGGQRLGKGELARQIRMRLDQRALLVRRPLRRRGGERLREAVGGVRTKVGLRGRPPRRSTAILRDAAEAFDEQRAGRPEGFQPPGGVYESSGARFRASSASKHDRGLRHSRGTWPATRRVRAGRQDGNAVRSTASGATSPWHKGVDESSR